MRLTKIKIRNFRGLEALDVDIPPAGVIAKGGNAKGKSSLLKAIRSVLEARDIGADAIRMGADKCELLVDLDAVSVKRAITPKTSTLVVERDGMRASKPTTYLRDLLGSSSLDPLELYLAKPKERRALILSALPCTITREQLAKYTGGDVPPDIDCSGHALEVIEKARAFFYEERTLANKEAADAKREADRLSEVARDAAAAVTPGPVLPHDAAKAAVVAAERAALAIEARASEAEKAAARTAAQRAEIERLKSEADAIAILDPIDLVPLTRAEEEAAAIVAELEAKLTRARDALLAAQRSVSAARATNQAREGDAVRALSLRTQARALESALAAATTAPPDAAEIAKAKSVLDEAAAALARAEAQAKAIDAIAAADRAKAEAKRLADEATDLDAAVKRLTNEAPAALLAAADGIPGLTVDGDEVRLDGKSLDALSGAEQLKFAVEVARRANAKTKVLVVDGLERLDTDQLRAFVNHATRDGWQLIGSLVTGGQLEVVAIEPDAQAAAAE